MKCKVLGIDKKDNNLKRILKTMSLIPNGVKTILDVGCKEGVLINQLHHKGYDCTGIDIDKESLKKVKCKKKVMDSTNLDFKDKSFDIVICCEVLEHLDNVALSKTLSEIQRVSKDFILITTPYKEDLRSNFTKCTHCLSTYNIYNHMRSFNEKSFKHLFSLFSLKKANGFVSTKKQNYFERFLKFNLGGSFISSSTSVCPICKKKSDYKAKFNLFSILSNLSYKILPHKKSYFWLYGLFERSL
jgi:ubiquinone/menaquinone biosynthesis C-methylase UbiE